MHIWGPDILKYNTLEHGSQSDTDTDNATPLVTGHWPQATGPCYWPLATGHWPLATGDWHVPPWPPIPITAYKAINRTQKDETHAHTQHTRTHTQACRKASNATQAEAWLATRKTKH